MGFGEFLKGLPVVGGLFDDSADQAMDQLKKNGSIWSQLQLPEFQNYNPEAYNSEDATASKISEDPAIRSAQLSALSKLSGLADTGLSDVDAYQNEQAKQLGAQQARAGNQAALEQSRARNMGGSGMEFGLREIANQEGATRTGQMALQSAADQARQRALYQQAYGSALSGMRGQDFTANQANANILNQFNLANTQARNQAAQYNVGQKNSAQQYNNQMKQQTYQDAAQRASGQTGANQQVAQGYYNEGAANQANRNSNAQLGFGIAGAAGAFGGGSPKFNTQTGESLFDPQTGKRYGG